MADKEARVLGAGAFVTAPDKDGKDTEYQVSPLNMKQLAEIQQECLRQFRRGYIQTYADAVEWLENGQEVLERKVDEAARFDVRDLPKKFAYDTRKIQIVEAVIQLLRKHYDIVPKKADDRRALLATALDSGLIDSETVKELTGRTPARASIPYDMWWVTANYAGIVLFVWTSVVQNHSEVTRDDVSKWPVYCLSIAGRLVESITAPAVENT